MLLEEKKYSWVGIALPAHLVPLVRAWRSKMPSGHILKTEAEPHITVKYGIHTDDPLGVAAVIERCGLSKISAKFGQTTYFENDTDVLVVEVESDELRQLNQLLSAELDVTNTHPDYKPHLTIAYLRKGYGPLYEGDGFMNGLKAVWDTVFFSAPDNEARFQLKLPRTVIETSRVDISGSAFTSLPIIGIENQRYDEEEDEYDDGEEDEYDDEEEDEYDDEEADEYDDGGIYMKRRGMEEARFIASILCASCRPLSDAYLYERLYTELQAAATLDTYIEFNRWWQEHKEELPTYIRNEIAQGIHRILSRYKSRRAAGFRKEFVRYMRRKLAELRVKMGVVVTTPQHRGKLRKAAVRTGKSMAEVQRIWYQALDNVIRKYNIPEEEMNSRDTWKRIQREFSDLLQKL